jgi:hypothetical protein
VSDFSVFHRVDDIATLPGPTFFRMAWRIGAYQGVMAIRAAEARKTEPEPARTVAVGPSWPAPRGAVTKETVDPAFKGIFSFG